jgi:hypothetical protein
MVRVIRGLSIVAVTFVTVVTIVPTRVVATPASGDPRTTIARLPLAFEPNVGQAPEDVRFVSQTAGHRLWLGQDDARFVSGRNDVPGSEDGIRVRWLGGRATASLVGAELQPGRAHYYLGRDPSGWRTDVPMYGRVVYRGVYPDVDLVFHGTQRDAEFDFVVHPGGDPRMVRLEITGADALALEGDDVVMRRGATRLRLHKPVVYQDTPAGRVPVAGRFTLHGQQVAFDIGVFDRTRPLVIDPVLTYSSYLGFGNDVVGAADGGLDIGIDSALNMYVVMPTRVVKLSADGSTLLYSTVIGDIQPKRIAVDAGGNAYLAANCGYPRSGFTFDCATTTALATCHAMFQGDLMGIVYKLRPDGTLVASTTIGGNSTVEMDGIAIDSGANIYLTGYAVYGGLPHTTGAFGPPAGTIGTGFVQAIAADFSRYLYAGAFTDANEGSVRPHAIAADATGAAYVTGFAGNSQFPTTAGSFQPTLAGASGAGFVTKLAPDGSQLVYSTFLGNQSTSPAAITVDGSGNAYVAGHAGIGLPTANAIQPAPASASDAFVTKLDPTGSALVFSTYLGGGADDAATGVGLDSAGNVYVAGATDSTDFPQRNALATPLGSAGSNFVTALTPGGNAFVYSTYFADAQTFVSAMTVAPGGAVFLTGTTSSTAYPTVRPFQAALNGTQDAFVARLDPGGATGTCGTGQFFAEYFGNVTLTPPAARTQCEASVSYDWGIGGPAGVPPDNFSARWTGRFNFAGGKVTFTARADDGVRVFLDGALIIDGWKDQPATTYTASPDVSAGEHEVKVEYYERGGDAVVQVAWTGAGGSACQAGLFLAEYFSNTTLTAPATRTACEGAPSYSWGTGGPAGLPVDNFSARWTGRPTFNAGTYTFTVRADDGVRLYLDGALLIDGWKDQPATTYTARPTLTAGTHEVKIEYYERGGDAVIQASWAPTGALPPPAITTLTPNSTTAGGPGFTLTVDGSGFVSGSSVFFNGHANPTTFVSATRLTSSIPLDDIKAAGTFPVFVVNPDGQRSNIVNFTVAPSGSSCPAGQFFAEYFANLALTAPATRTACEASVSYDWGAGGPAGLPVDNFSARWTGSFPFANETVTFTVRADDGVRLYLDGTLIIDAWKDQPATTYTRMLGVTSGNHQIKVEYYERGGDAVIQLAWGGTTTGLTLTTLTPSSATAGGPAFTLTADGTGFVAGATLRWNGAARTTTFVSATRVTASIPASDIAAAGSVPVTVANPDGTTSSAQTFTITPAGGDTIKVFITAPANNATVRGTVWFTVWLENTAAGSKTVTLSVNGTTIGSPTTTTSNGPISLAWSTTTADNGARTATVSVRDSANATGRASITLNVAN